MILEINTVNTRLFGGKVSQITKKLVKVEFYKYLLTSCLPSAIILKPHIIQIKIHFIYTIHTVSK